MWGGPLLPVPRVPPPLHILPAHPPSPLAPPPQRWSLGFPSASPLLPVWLGHTDLPSLPAVPRGLACPGSPLLAFQVWPVPPPSSFGGWPPALPPLPMLA
eukprot:gene5433-biopygen19239